MARIYSFILIKSKRLKFHSRHVTPASNYKIVIIGKNDNMNMTPKVNYPLQAKLGKCQATPSGFEPGRKYAAEDPPEWCEGQESVPCKQEVPGMNPGGAACHSSNLACKVKFVECMTKTCGLKTHQVYTTTLRVSFLILTTKTFMLIVTLVRVVKILYVQYNSIVMRSVGKPLQAGPETPP